MPQMPQRCVQLGAFRNNLFDCSLDNVWMLRYQSDAPPLAHRLTIASMDFAQGLDLAQLVPLHLHGFLIFVPLLFELLFLRIFPLVLLIAHDILLFLLQHWSGTKEIKHCS